MADHDFELTPLGPQAWSAPSRPGLMLPGGRTHWGGYALGIMMKSILAEPQRKGAPAAMTVSYIGPLQDAEIQVSNRLLRQGGTLEFWRSEVSQGGGAPAAHGDLILGHRKPTRRFGWLEMPKTPLPEDLPTYNGPAGFLREYEFRGEKMFPPGDGTSISSAWIRFKDGRALDYVNLAMAADRFPPRHVAVYGWGAMQNSTISLTAYFHATAEEIDAVGDDFVLCHAEGRSGSDSLFDMAGSIWRRDGLLLMTTEQLCWFREPRGEA
jgi:hypothetical protein